MAIRYTPEELKHLRDSPLVVKPTSLPPAEQWMGAPPDTSRNVSTRPHDRNKNHDSNPLLEQSRRPGLDRHISRSSANPEDIILGPPKTSFMSATSIRAGSKPFDSPDRPPLRETESRDRYSFRGRGESDADRARDTRNNNLRPNKRNDGEQDSQEWSTVKSRKSFGTQGAERFNGRMGLDRNREDKKSKEREDRDPKDKPRGFDNYSRDSKEHDHEPERETRRNNGIRGRNEPTWRDREHNDKDNDLPTASRDLTSNGERFPERARGWREKDDTGDRGGGRYDRSERRGAWGNDRNHQDERDPEWLDEPSDKKKQARTQDDFQKWKEQMHQDKGTGGKSATDESRFQSDAGASFFGLGEKPKPEPVIETPVAIDTGPDKFFGMWGSKDERGPEAKVDTSLEGAPKAKTVGKASRFTSFFSPQEEPQRRQTEPPPPVPALQGGLEALFQPKPVAHNDSTSNPQLPEEKFAFMQLIEKLQSQAPSGSGTTPPIIQSQQLRPSVLEKAQSYSATSPDPFQQFRQERQEDVRPNTRGAQQPSIQDLLTQRHMTGSQSSIRPEQVLQDLVGNRQNALSQGSMRPDQPPSRNNNTEFLMGLMQSAKAAPEPLRSEQIMLRMQPKSSDRQLQQQMLEREHQEMAREAAAQRERSASQRTRHVPPPGLDMRWEQGPPQPTQILQRPPPPGLDMWEQRGPPQSQPQQHRLPPGLAGVPQNRGIPLPQQQQMFPPGFQMNSFPPEPMTGPPRNMMQPPPGFQNFGPPPGFLPGNFSMPNGAGFGVPFDGRGGPPPPGGFRRQ